MPRPLRFHGWIFVLLALIFSAARGQTLDANFNPGADSYVYALAAQTGGRILVAGAFTKLAGQPRSFLGRLNADGSPDASFAPSLNGVVRCVTVQPDGKILIGGQFTVVNGQSRGHIARLNADGSLDPTFNPGAGTSAANITSGEVTCFALQPDGKIILGGGFESVAGQTRNGLARLNAAGALDLTFDPNVTGIFVSNPGATPGVLCLALQADGKVVFGGQFTAVGGQARNGFARVNADGSLDTAFNPSTTPAAFNAVALQADGRILTGGSFVRLGGQLQANVARLNANGSLDAGFAANVTGALASVFVQGDGRVLLGLFPNVSPAQHATFLRLSSFGSAESDFTFDLTSADAQVFAPVATVLPLNDGSLVIGGNFNAVGGVPRGNLARLLPVAPGWLANLSARGYVPPGGDLTVGIGARGGPKSLLVRGIGPALAAFGVSGVLADPRLDEFRPGAVTTESSSDDWQNNLATVTVFQAVGAFALPAFSKDAALATTLTNGTTTVRLTSAAPGGSGIALAEIYDRGRTGDVPSARLTNLSALGLVGPGAQALVPGFVIGGVASKTLLIRAIGPALAQFGVGDALPDPQIALIPLGASTVVAINDNWGGDATTAAAFTAAGAFALPANSKDSALVVRLAPGGYTVVVSGVGVATGRALVEIYDLDP